MRTARIYHTPEEKEYLLTVAVELLRRDPSLSMRQLFIRAQLAALPKDRQRQTTTMPKHTYEWLLTGAMARIERENHPVPKPAPVVVEPPVVSTVVPTARALAEALAVRLGEEEEARDVRFGQLEQTVQNLTSQVSGLTNQVAAFGTMLEKILGDLTGYQEAKGLETTNHNGLSPDLVKVPAPAKAPKPAQKKITIMGLDTDRFQSVQKKLGGGVILKCIGLNRRFGDEAIKNSDWVVIAPMVNHSDANRVKDLIGSNRVIRPRHGGIDAMVKEIVQVTGPVVTAK